jgi:WD40 repeat protein
MTMANLHRLFVAACLALAMGQSAGAQDAPRTDHYGDPLPAGALARMGTVRFRHGGPVRLVGFSPDGRLVASTSGDGFFTVWETATGKEVRRLNGQLHGAASVAFAPDGKTLTLVGTDLKLHVWDLASGKELRSLAPPKDCRSALVSADARIGAFLNAANSLGLWDLATGKEIRRLALPAPPQKGGKDPRSEVRLIAIAPDGGLLAVAEGDVKTRTMILRIWEVATGKERTPVSHPGSLSALTFSADGRTLVVGSQGQALLLFDRASSKQLRRVAALGANDSLIAFAPDGRTLAVFNGGKIDLVETATGQVVRQLPGEPVPLCIAFAPDGKHLAVGGPDGVVRLRDTATGKEVRPTPGHQGTIATVVCSPDGNLLATASADRTVRLWEAGSGREIRRLTRAGLPADGGKEPPGPPALAFAGSRTLVAAWTDGWILSWDVVTGKELRRKRVSGHPLHYLSFSPGGSTLAAGASDGAVHLWDPATGRERRRVARLADPVSRGGAGRPQVSAITLAPDGRTVATEHGSAIIGDGTAGTIYYFEGYQNPPAVHLWETASGKARGLVTPEDRPGGMFGASIYIRPADPNTLVRWAGASTPPVFSPDCRTLAVVSGNAVRLWDLARGREIRRLAGLASCMALAFSPDGALLAQSGSGRFILVEVASGDRLAEIPARQGEITTVTFSPDGARLITGGSDTTTLVWDVRRLAEQAWQRAKMTPKKLEEWWADLASADAARAARAVWALAAMPEHSVPLLRQRLRPVARVEAARLARLVADLGHERYAVRQQATRELEQLGDVAEAALQQALEGKPALEMGRRVDQLLQKLEGPIASPELLRALRAVEVMERAGTPEARQLLEPLAGGAPGARLTQEARAALERLARRAASP